MSHVEDDFPLFDDDQRQVSLSFSFETIRTNLWRNWFSSSSTKPGLNSNLNQILRNKFENNQFNNSAATSRLLSLFHFVQFENFVFRQTKTRENSFFTFRCSMQPGRLFSSRPLVFLRRSSFVAHFSPRKSDLLRNFVRSKNILLKKVSQKKKHFLFYRCWDEAPRLPKRPSLSRLVDRFGGKMLSKLTSCSLAVTSSDKDFLKGFRIFCPELKLNGAAWTCFGAVRPWMASSRPAIFESSSFIWIRDLISRSFSLTISLSRRAQRCERQSIGECSAVEIPIALFRHWRHWKFVESTMLKREISLRSEFAIENRLFVSFSEGNSSCSFIVSSRKVFLLILSKDKIV